MQPEVPDEIEFPFLDSVADVSCARARRGEKPILVDDGDDWVEYAADLGRREAMAVSEEGR